MCHSQCGAVGLACFDAVYQSSNKPRATFGSGIDNIDNSDDDPHDVRNYRGDRRIAEALVHAVAPGGRIACRLANHEVFYR